MTQRERTVALHPRLLWLGAGGMILALAALALWVSLKPGPIPPGRLAGSSLGGPFSLVDQDGRHVTSDSYRGRYRLMYFGFTYCPDICPTDVQRMSRALRLFEQRDRERAARVQPIMVTIDPDRDTPAVLKQFVAQFHPRLVGLTGDPASISQTVRRFAVSAERTGAGTSYSMDHSAKIYLMDPTGRPITFFDRDATPQQIEAGMALYVR